MQGREGCNEVWVVWGAERCRRYAHARPTVPHLLTPPQGLKPVLPSVEGRLLQVRHAVAVLGELPLLTLPARPCLPQTLGKVKASQPLAVPLLPLPVPTVPLGTLHAQASDL